LPFAVVAAPHQYFTWNKWGRVGEERGMQNALRGPMSKDAAKGDFCKKFSDKTKNNWENRANFVTKAGKYTLLEKDYGADDAAPAPAPAGGGGGSGSSAPVESKLDKRVQSLVSLIADIRMMEMHMREIGFDPNKMPLGKLKKTTVMQGYKVLQELSQLIVGGSAISGGGGGGGGGGSGGGGSSGGGGVASADMPRVYELSSQFYSIIPHTSDGDRGTRTVLPPINTAKMLKDKIEMIEALGEIELASRVIDTKAAVFDMHPIDARYAQLKTKLTPSTVLQRSNPGPSRPPLL
jgi:poly [ADP-ribose] polymerase